MRAALYARVSTVDRWQDPTHMEAAIRRDLQAAVACAARFKAHGVGSRTVQPIKAELADPSA
jgi:hypothetical protein